MTQRFASFEEFWPHYVLAHAKPATRWLHVAGVAAACACLAAFAKTRRTWLLPAALVVGYGPAWIGHFVVERNRPATLRHPLWSFCGDLRMFRLTCLGRMDAEVARARAAAAAGTANGAPSNGKGSHGPGGGERPPVDRTMN